MDCHSIMHRLHLCALSSPEHEELVTELTKDPTVVCDSCGAWAHDAQNLCSPSPLPHRRSGTGEAETS